MQELLPVCLLIVCVCEDVGAILQFEWIGWDIGFKFILKEF